MLKHFLVRSIGKFEVTAAHLPSLNLKVSFHTINSNIKSITMPKMVSDNSIYSKAIVDEILDR